MPEFEETQEDSPEVLRQKLSAEIAKNSKLSDNLDELTSAYNRGVGDNRKLSATNSRLIDTLEARDVEIVELKNALELKNSKHQAELDNIAKVRLAVEESLGSVDDTEEEELDLEPDTDTRADLDSRAYTLGKGRVLVKPTPTDYTNYQEPEEELQARVESLEDGLVGLLQAMELGNVDRRAITQRLKSLLAAGPEAQERLKELGIDTLETDQDITPPWERDSQEPSKLGDCVEDWLDKVAHDSGLTKEQLLEPMPQTRDKAHEGARAAQLATKSTLIAKTIIDSATAIVDSIKATTIEEYIRAEFRQASLEVKLHNIAQTPLQDIEPMACGGLVPTGPCDDVPVPLHTGESYVSKDAAKFYGKELLARLAQTDRQTLHDKIATGAPLFVRGGEITKPTVHVYPTHEEAKAAIDARLKGQGVPTTEYPDIQERMRKRLEREGLESKDTLKPQPLQPPIVQVVSAVDTEALAEYLDSSTGKDTIISAIKDNAPHISKALDWEPKPQPTGSLDSIGYSMAEVIVDTAEQIAQATEEGQQWELPVVARLAANRLVAMARVEYAKELDSLLDQVAVEVGRLCRISRDKRLESKDFMLTYQLIKAYRARRHRQATATVESLETTRLETGHTTLKLQPEEVALYKLLLGNYHPAAAVQEVAKFRRYTDEELMALLVPRGAEYMALVVKEVVLARLDAVEQKRARSHGQDTDSNSDTDTEEG